MLLLQALTVSLESFALCGERQGGSAPLTPATFEKVDETFAWLRSAVTFLIISRNFLQFQYIQFLHFAEGIFGDYFTSA